MLSIQRLGCNDDVDPDADDADADVSESDDAVCDPDVRALDDADDAAAADDALEDGALDDADDAAAAAAAADDAADDVLGCTWIRRAGMDFDGRASILMLFFGAMVCMKQCA